MGNEIHGEERKRVEQYFLRSTQRQNKVKFAAELLERAAVERGTQVPTAEPGFSQHVRLFWARQSFSLRAGIMFATVVILVGVGLLAYTSSRVAGSYAMLNLAISNSDRSVGSETKSVRLEPGSAGIRIELALPEQVSQAKNYRVELVDEQQLSRELQVEERKPQSIVVTVPASVVKRGSYIIRLYAKNGTEQRVRGSYSFAVE